MIILGMDPGSLVTGFALLEYQASRMKALSHGIMRLAPSHNLGERLFLLFNKVTELFIQHRPHMLVLEKVFVARYPHAALQLGHARGVILLCAAQHGVPWMEYSSTEVKRRITGSGRAPKEQVARVLQYLVGRQRFEAWDASDALALCLCHAFSSSHAVPPSRTASMSPSAMLVHPDKSPIPQGHGS
jgi:crossover junction endodeoxyribonuclease RuvC